MASSLAIARPMPRLAPVGIAYRGRASARPVPKRRLGEGAAAAKRVRAIADGLLDYATGQISNIDGGFHLRSL